MPNWCYTDYVFEGNKKEIKELNRKAEKIKWLSDLVIAYGGNPKEIECRGSIMDVSLYNDNTLHIYTETAWTDTPEVWELVMKKHKSLSCYYYTEEIGCGIYETNDVEGKYFPDRFIVYTGEAIMLETEQDVFACVGKIVEKEINNWDEAFAAIDEWNFDRIDDEISVEKIIVVNKL